jgi:hypothetical protein
MSKPYTESDFSNQIAEGRTWRVKEISDLKDAIKRADEHLQRVLLRALVAICYAHWEGYVRYSAKKYLEHVALRKFKYSDLDRQFFRNYFLLRLAPLATTKFGIAERCAIIDDILDSSDRQFKGNSDELINTKANLNFEVFVDICIICSVPKEPFVDYYNFINLMLLKRRNEIAHGENTLVALSDLDKTASDTITLMRTFGDQLENRVALKNYKAA